MKKEILIVLIGLCGLMTFSSESVSAQTDERQNLQCTQQSVGNEKKTYLVGAGKMSPAERKRIEEQGVIVPQGETERAKEVRKRAIKYQQEIRDKVTKSMAIWMKANPNATAEQIEQRRRQGQERIEYKINSINEENKVRTKSKSWDWRAILDVGPVLNQEPCNTCWAFATTAAVFSSLQKNYEDGIPLANYLFPDKTTGELSGNPFIKPTSTGTPFPFVQDLLNCMPVKKEQICDAGWHGNVFDFMVYQKGIPISFVSNSNVNYQRDYKAGQKFACQPGGGFIKASSWDYVNSPADELPPVEQLKTALIEHGPLVAPITSDKCLGSYKGGVFNENNKKEISHVVLLIGWDDEKGAWLVKNSWGVEWGEKGFGWIKYGSNNIGVFAAWIEADKPE